MKNKNSIFQVWAYSKTSDHDNLIRKTANAECFGSGFGPEGRDNSFFADTEQAAEEIKNRLMLLACITKVEVHSQNGYRTFKNKKDHSNGTWKDYE